jgi:serine protease
LTNDTRNWVMSHDATTLGGNSGSIVVSVNVGLPACALHFAGAPLTANYAHALSAVRASGVLPNDVIARLNFK